MSGMVRSQRIARLIVLGSLVLLGAIFAATLLLSINAASGGADAAVKVFAGGFGTFVLTALILGTCSLRYFKELEKHGLRDQLTGLANRRALHIQFAEHLQAHGEIAIALINLDGFRLVNDHYGHQVGDAALVEASRFMQEICGKDAQVYRLGGDDFGLMMSGPLAGTFLEGQSRRVMEHLAKPIAIEGRRVMLGASIGLASCTAQDACASSELLRRADVAMSSSKKNGRMRCTWFSESFDHNREEKRKLDEELRHALTAGEFRLAYQPLVASDTGRVVAVECLLRWERADGKQIGPHIFIPAAEESGFINAIGLWVLRQACTDALAWDDIILSVNISAAQLRNPEFPILLGHILEETGFDPARLELEVTETCLVLDPILAERNLDLIRKFGVRIALDDFGTGYASIGFLRQFRFEKLKIDRSLVVQAGQDEGSRAMMLSSIAVARALQMGVTAEGVETEEQAAMVRAAGCDQIQGWLYFRALPSHEIAQHLGREIRPGGGTKPAAIQHATPHPGGRLTA